MMINNWVGSPSVMWPDGPPVATVSRWLPKLVEDLQELHAARVVAQECRASLDAVLPAQTAALAGDEWAAAAATDEQAFASGKPVVALVKVLAEQPKRYAMWMAANRHATTLVSSWDRLARGRVGGDVRSKVAREEVAAFERTVAAAERAVSAGAGTAGSARLRAAWAELAAMDEAGAVWRELRALVAWLDGSRWEPLPADVFPDECEEALALRDESVRRKRELYAAGRR